MKTYVALLRGINVGGKRKIPMAGLRPLFSSLGFEDVVTYVQSGNVVFRSPTGDSRDITSRIEKRIADVFGIDVAVLLRTTAELEEIAESNPFLAKEISRGFMSSS